MPKIIDNIHLKTIDKKKLNLTKNYYQNTQKKTQKDSIRIGNRQYVDNITWVFRWKS